MRLTKKRATNGRENASNEKPWPVPSSSRHCRTPYHHKGNKCYDYWKKAHRCIDRCVAVYQLEVDGDEVDWPLGTVSPVPLCCYVPSHLKTVTRQLTNIAAPQAAIITHRSNTSLFHMNCTGNILPSKLVRKLKLCCRPNKTNSTPLATKSPIFSPLFHAYIAPPKLIAIIPGTHAPISRTEPSQSISMARDHIVTS